MSHPPRYEIFPTVSEAIERTARLVTTLCRAANEAQGFASLALSGGNTPRALYSRLADSNAPYRSEMPWNQIEFFWGDERAVPPTDPESNYKMAWDAMLSQVPANASRIHRFHTEAATPELAACDYDDKLKSFARQLGAKLPRFDVTLLGMGGDGHTASLFPGTSWAEESDLWVKAIWVEKLRTFRYSLLPTVLNESRAVLFLVTGKEKAPVVREILGKNPVPGKYPVQSIIPRDGEVVWLLDAEAAGGCFVKPTPP